MQVVHHQEMPMVNTEPLECGCERHHAGHAGLASPRPGTRATRAHRPGGHSAADHLDVRIELGSRVGVAPGRRRLDDACTAMPRIAEAVRKARLSRSPPTPRTPQRTSCSPPGQLPSRTAATDGSVIHTKRDRRWLALGYGRRSRVECGATAGIDNSAACYRSPGEAPLRGGGCQQCSNQLS
jgi:hypothetical protein